MDQLAIIDRIFADRPPFHRIDTEVRTPHLATHTSALPASELAGYATKVGRTGIRPVWSRPDWALIKPE
jgi:hypothetical protein